MSHITKQTQSLLASTFVKPGVSKRADFPLIPSKTALLVIDIQDHLSSEINAGDDKESYLFSTALKKAVPNIVQLVDTFRSIRDSDEDDVTNCKCEVIFTYLESLTPNRRDISLDYKLSGPLLSSSLPTPIHKATFNEIPSSLKPSSTKGKGDILLPKTSCSVFASTNINYVLKNLHIEQIVVCGQLTDQCVLSAVRDLADAGYFVSVVQDACAALSSSEHLRGILGMQGFARILSTRDVLNEIVQQAEPTSQKDKRFIADENEVELDKSFQTNMSVVVQSAERVAHVSPILQKWECIQPWEPTKPISNVVETLLHTLQYANIKFLRYTSIDLSNTLRSKVIPVENFTQSYSELYNKVAIAKICIGGLPSYADTILPDTGLDAQHVLMVQPDISSLRILPYTKSSAMVFGTLHQCTSSRGLPSSKETNMLGSVSEYCTRSLLQRVLHFAKIEYGIGFAVGAEIEFILVRPRNDYDHHKNTTMNNTHERSLLDIIEPIDTTVFATTKTLNEQDEFLNDVYDTLRKQNIHVETFHSESAPGQLEVVLPYQKDAVKIADMIVLTREAIKATATKYGLCALFLPKVFEMSAGNGMHVHLSLYSVDEPNVNLFPTSTSSSEATTEEATLLNDQNVHNPNQKDPRFLISKTGQSFLEGILSHLKALTSLTLPTSNSYQRVGKGCWTGHSIDWMVEEKESPLRVCLGFESSTGRMQQNFFEATNVELKLMDNTCNVYLALACILFSGLDGIERKMSLRAASSSSSAPEQEEQQEQQKERKLPTSLEESLDNLLDDDVLTGLLGEKLLKSYMGIKKAEIKNDKEKSISELVSEAMKR